MSRRVIWKQTVPVGYSVPVQLPLGARVVHVCEQDGQPCIWFHCNPEEQKEGRLFLVVGTGHEFGNGLAYVGTAHVPPFVWHVMEVQP